jgi:hypothetical protein
MEDDLVTTAERDDLPVAPPQRLLSPPAVLDQPGLANRIDLATVDDLGTAIGGGADRDRARL